MCQKSLQLKSAACKDRNFPGFEYAATKLDLAYCLVSEGKYNEAIASSKEAADFVEAEEGADGISTARFRFHYACMAFS